MHKIHVACCRGNGQEGPLHGSSFIQVVKESYYYSFSYVFSKVQCHERKHEEDQERIHDLEGRLLNLTMSFDSTSGEAHHFFEAFEEAKKDYCILQEFIREAAPCMILPKDPFEKWP